MDDLALPADAIRASAGNVVPAERFMDGVITEDEFRSSGWAVTTRGGAAWALAKYREKLALADGIRRQAAEWRADVDAWERAALEPLNRSLDFLGENLRRYALEQREESRGKIKTISLPSGRVETHGTTRPRICVDDEAALLAWAKANQPEAVKTTESPLVSKLEYVVQRDEGAVWGKLIEPGSGEVIPGVHAEWSPTTAEVKV